MEDAPQTRARTRGHGPGSSRKNAQPPQPETRQRNPRAVNGALSDNELTSLARRSLGEGGCPLRHRTKSPWRLPSAINGSSACFAFAEGVARDYSLSHMKLRLVLEHDPDTKRWAAFFPELPGCASAGDTEEEAVRNAKEALELWFDPAPVTLSAGAKVLEVALT